MCVTDSHDMTLAVKVALNPYTTNQQCKGLTHYQATKILDSSKLKEFADDNFKFDENGIKLSKRVENTVRKGEIARYEQFLLFPQCFQKACFPGASKGVIVWEWVKITNIIFYNSLMTVFVTENG